MKYLKVKTKKRGFTPLEITGAKKKHKVNKSLEGFTLLEVIVSVFMVTVGLLGVMSLLQRTISSVSLSSSRLTAGYLAQEGIEIIRNVRDTNWLQARTASSTWDEGLINCGGAGIVADYNHSYGPNQLDSVFPCYSDQFLNVDSNGFYGYSSGTQTKFKRKILITAVDSDTQNVLVQISWTEKGASFAVSVRENLYNWR